MEITKTMRVTGVREILDGTPAPANVELTLVDAESPMAMEQARLVVPKADERPTGTHFTVTTTYTEVTA